MIIGIDIGGTKTAVIFGENEKVVRREAFKTSDWKSTLDTVMKIMEECDSIEAVGISCGGPLDSKKGIIMSPPNLPGWDNVEVVRMIKERFNVPVMLQNDANACAVAEWKFGAGKGSKNMVFFTFGTGLGAGIIIDGKLYSGTNDMAGEAGHIRLSDHGPVGYGKAGSFEGFCSGAGIAALGKIKATEQLQMGKSVSYCKSYDELSNVTAKLIADFAHNGEEDAKDVYRECGRMLGFGLSVIIDILNPERIVLGSVFERSHDLLTEEMYKVINKETLEASRKVCEILPAKLGDEIGDYAALAIGYTALAEERK